MQMLKIVLATSNPHKVEEINAITNGFGVEFILPPEGFDPIENGKTFKENSIIKAKEANKITGLPALADDSGLCVNALNGEPGIHSARYADTPQARIDKLLDAIKDVPEGKRDAKFVCAMTLVNEYGKIIFSDIGECHGKIAFEQKGTNGFGYDPIFIISDSNISMAELPEKEKNAISHRGIALQKLINFLNISKKIY